MHLIVEADDREALSRGIQGLAIRLARTINRAQQRKGRVFADHYFEHRLRTPAEARHAIRYVEQNQRLHETARRPSSARRRRWLLVRRAGCAGLSSADLALAHRLAPRPRTGPSGRLGLAMKSIHGIKWISMLVALFAVPSPSDPHRPPKSFLKQRYCGVAVWKWPSRRMRHPDTQEVKAGAPCRRHS